MEKADSKEIMTSIAKSLFSAIPYAGTALTELIFDYNGRVKQNRLNKFVEILSEGFAENSDINIDNIKTEHFNDLFEAVLKRVFITSSERKLVRFKNVIIDELKVPTELDMISVHLDLINDLSENELLILYHHKNFNKIYLSERDEIRNTEKRINIAKLNHHLEIMANDKDMYINKIGQIYDNRKTLEEKHEMLQEYRDPHFYNLSEEKYFFYVQRLYSKALLLDSGNQIIGVEPFHMMTITEFGQDIIKFIKDKDF